jgi:MinD-like ATPase involved in chromosome partitioning or flagellar assembly
MEFNRYDFFIMDTFPGLSRNVVALCKSSLEIVLVMTSDAKSLKNAYSLLKALSAKKYDGAVMVLINMSRDLKVARKSYQRFKEAVFRYLPISVIPLGTVFYDSRVRNAEAARHPFISLFPDSDASRCIVNIARHLSEKKIDDLAVSAFWAKFIENLNHPFQLVGKPRSAVLRQQTAGRVSGEVPASDPDNGSGKSTHDALERLERQLSVLSKEVSGIRQTLQSVSEAQNAMTAPEPKPEISNPQKPEKLALDFEAFLEQWKRGST